MAKAMARVRRLIPMVKTTPIRLILSLIERERVLIGGMMKKADDHVDL